MPTMIFHSPFPLNREARAASGIRPVRMRDAFEELGYDVIEVTGYARERRASLKRVRDFLKNGGKIDFLYSESATIPTMLTEPRHFPPHPLLDRALFRLCSKNHIPTSLFYRDVYWNFPSYTDDVGTLVSAVMRWAYTYDLRWYEKYVDSIYLPSLLMGKHVPLIQEEKKKALPPGTSDFLGEKAEIQQGNLRVLYVGGIGAHYQLHTLFDVVRNNKFVTLFVCVPEQQWADLEHEYSGLLAENIKVVHYYGPALEKLFLKTDLCSLFVAPSDYRAFAAPVKLYDYIGHHKPVIATKGTLAGDFVSTNGCGWTIEYDQEQLADLLTYLSQNPEEVETYQSNVADLAVLHTWKARAQQVVQDAERISVRYSSSRTVRK